MEKFSKLISSIFKSKKISSVKISLNKNWTNFDNKNTIGKTGSENGIIVFDCENINGARITLESGCGNIPFAITFGIYGIMFHTEYFSDLSLAIIYILERQNIIDKIFVLYNISEDDRDKEWDKEYADLFYNLV